MPTEHLVPEGLRDLYLVREWRNATDVLETARPDAWRDIVEVPFATFRGSRGR